MFHGPPLAKIKRELSPSKELSPCSQDRSPMPYGEKCLYSYRYFLMYIHPTQKSIKISMYSKMTNCFHSLLMQCLWKEAQHWVQAIDPSLDTRLPLCLQQCPRNVSPAWTDSSICVQHNTRSASPTWTAFNDQEHTQPDVCPSPQPEPTLCSTLSTPESWNSLQ